ADRYADLTGRWTVLLLAHPSQPQRRRRLCMTATSVQTAVAQALHNVSYQTGNHKMINEVSLEVNYGEVLALVGPNGAGKSTLLGLFAGDLHPTAGTVSLEGRDLADWDAKELARIRAVLLQANQVAFSFTARDVIEMG